MYFLSIRNDAGDVIEFPDGMSRDDAEYMAGKVHTMLRRGGFRGAVCIETFDGDEVDFPTDEQPDWEKFPA